MNMVRLFAVATGVVAAAVSPALAAVVVSTETTFVGGEKARARPGKVLLAGDRLRAEMPAGPRAQDGDVVVVFRGDRETVWVLDPAERSYVEIDRGTVREMGGTLAAVKDQVREQMQGMSPEARERMQEMMGDIGLGDGSPPPPPIRLSATGKTATVDGRSCREQAIVRGEQRIGDLCLADWSALGLSRADLEPVRRLAALQSELARSLPIDGAASVAIDPHAVASLDGVPVRVRVREPGQPATDTRVVGVERADAPEDAFSPPAGWRKRSWIESMRR